MNAIIIQTIISIFKHDPHHVLSHFLDPLQGIVLLKNKRSRQSDIYNYLKENYPQLTNDAIAGIMGNIGVETGYTYEYTTRQNENTSDKMGPGMGLFQFDEQRKPYKNWLKENDKSTFCIYFP